MDSFARLLDTCARCLSRHENLAGDRPVLAAISGGVDSTLLLFVLQRLAAEGRLPGPLHIAHVDHGVRPDSRDTARHVIELCERFDLPIAIRRLQLDDDHPSEDAMRRARYDALLDIAAEVGSRLLLLAHHADDNLETVLFRMLRGTGVRGLAGIPESRWLLGSNHRVLLLRPWLRTRRSTIEKTLERLGEPVHVDRTNGDTTYARNRLRLETIPALRDQLGIGLDVALMTVASTARAANEILEAQGLRILTQRTRHRTTWRLELDLRGLDADSRPFVTEALRQSYLALHPHGEAPLQSWLERALALLDKPDGKRLAGRGGLLVERTRDGLLLLDPDRAGAAPRTHDGGQLFHFDQGRQRFGATEWWLDANEHPLPPLVPTPAEAGRLRALLDPRGAPLPWRLRTRRAGDVFQPLGSEQAMDLRRFLMGRHVPRFDRDRMPLLVDARDRVLWVPGVEVGEPARLRLNTRRCIEVRAGFG
ncbi:MAG: tRNA lysidine(34) synthetase TilS [Planctomycetes bacterium]|nr:tRNA lysidine(34) synthetase TilS [Planctomycetota bacterium]